MSEQTLAARGASVSSGGARDRDDLVDLVYRFYACLDEHRFADLAHHITDDVAATTPGGSMAGSEAVITMAARNHKDYPRLQHNVTNLLIDIGGERAAVRANLVGIFGRDDLRPVRQVGSVCVFGALRVDDEWRFDRIQITPTWRVDADEASVA